MPSTSIPSSLARPPLFQCPATERDNARKSRRTTYPFHVVGCIRGSVSRFRFGQARRRESRPFGRCLSSDARCRRVQDLGNRDNGTFRTQVSPATQWTARHTVAVHLQGKTKGKQKEETDRPEDGMMNDDQQGRTNDKSRSLVVGQREKPPRSLPWPRRHPTSPPRWMNTSASQCPSTSLGIVVLTLWTTLNDDH